MLKFYLFYLFDIYSKDYLISLDKRTYWESDSYGSTYSGYNAIRIFLKPNKKIKYNTHKIIEIEKKFFSNFCLLDNYT